MRGVRERGGEQRYGPRFSARNAAAPEGHGFEDRAAALKSEESGATWGTAHGAVYNERGKERRGNAATGGREGGRDTQVRGKERYGVRGWTRRNIDPRTSR